MDIILLERIENLGQMGDVVSVKSGYARNFLFPRKKALRASESNLQHFQTQRKELEAENLKRKSEAEDIANRLNGLKVAIIRSAGEAGQLYGSVNARDIADSVSDNGFKIARNQVVIDRPFKLLGIFDIRIRLHPEVDAFVSVNVARSEDEAKQQQKLGRAIIGGEDEQQQAEEELAQSVIQRSEEMFEPEAQAKAAAELAKEDDDSEQMSPDAGGLSSHEEVLADTNTDQDAGGAQSDSTEKQE